MRRVARRQHDADRPHLVALGHTSRMLYLLDTDQCHPKPDAEKDRDLWGNNPVDEWIGFRRTDESSSWAYVSIHEVRANCQAPGITMDKMKLVRRHGGADGSDDTGIGTRLDPPQYDWYASAKTGLETFWPRLSPGGILVVDDYGHYRGQRQAVDEYFAGHPVKLNRVGLKTG